MTLDHYGADDRPTPTIPTAMSTDTESEHWPGSIWIGTIDVAQLAGEVILEGAERYRVARLLVRDGRRPLHFVEVAVNAGSVSGTRISEELLAAGDRSPQHPDGAHTSPITVVICTRDRPELLRSALDSVLALDYPEFEVVVVDNASKTDQTAKLVASLADARVRLVREDRPGLSRARNSGALAARHEILAFTDDDVVVDRWWLRGIADGFGMGPRVACVCGIVPSGEVQSLSQRYFDARVTWARNLEATVYTTDQPPPGNRLFPFGVGLYGTGANFAITRSVLMALGGFDEGLGVGSPARGGEDIDMFVRVLLAGHDLAYEPAALVWHRHRRDVVALRSQVHDYGVGLGAWIIKLALNPRTLRMIASRSRSALVHGYRVARVHLPDPDPEISRMTAQLARTERAGMLAGPVAYARSRLQGRPSQPLRSVGR